MPWVALGVAAIGAVGAASKAPPIMAPTAAAQDGNMFDSSGWNIAFGGSKITSSREQASGPAAVANSYFQYVVAAGVFLILWRMTKRKK